MEKISEAELRLIRRVRSLGVGTHNLTLIVGKSGPDIVAVTGSGKTEVLKTISPSDK